MPKTHSYPKGAIHTQRLSVWPSISNRTDISPKIGTTASFATRTPPGTGQSSTLRDFDISYLKYDLVTPVSANARNPRLCKFSDKKYRESCPTGHASSNVSIQVGAGNIVAKSPPGISLRSARVRGSIGSDTTRSIRGGAPPRPP